MKPIVIHEPVWNGGRTKVSIKESRIHPGNNFLVCDYRNKNGDRTFPHVYYLPSSYCTTIHTERWGKAYHVYLDDLETVAFWFTVAWTGEADGEYSTSRYTFDDMVEGIKDYLNKWDGRGAWLECCSLETSNKSHHVDLTGFVKAILDKEAS